MIPPVLITGCARSRTSMVAGCFAISGLFMGETSGPNRFNQKGMFENSHIREKVVKPYLRSIGADPLGQSPLPDTSDIIIPPFWNEAIDSTMVAEGYKDGPWGYKGAKMCLMWPVWHVAYPKAKWIIVRRSNQGIVNSCLRTGFMRAYKNSEGWGRWITHHLNCFDEMRNAKLDVREIWSDDIVRGNLGELQEAIEYCGLTFNRKDIQDFIEPGLTFV